MKIETLTKKDYNEAIKLMNDVFSVHNKCIMDFEKELPKMCVADDEHMNKYVAIRENGKIVASVGIYPLYMNVCGESLTFSTVGNVVTDESARGKGYMNALMTEAMKKLEQIGADGSRLGGNRQRYNRFGYELSGMQYDFTISDNTAKTHIPATDILFEQLCKDDIESIKKINEIHKSKPFYVDRCENDTLFGVYQTLTAWRNTPYIAKTKDGKIAGYITVSPDGSKINDIGAITDNLFKEIIFSWQKVQKGDIIVTIPPHNSLLNYFLSIAQDYKMYPPCNFKIINFEKMANAFIKLKSTYIPNPADGEYIIGIEGYGNLKLFCKDGIAGCEKTELTPAKTMDKLTATRFLFGGFGMYDSQFLNSWLPLPLSWNTLDRV